MINKDKRILLVNDYSELKTGYGIYGKNLLERFVRDGYEVAELATFCSNPSHNKWKIYPNLPKNDLEHEVYISNPQHSNGKWKFEEVCLDFKPTHVLDIRDVYMYEFESYSPFRKNYNWIIMATIDGLPQHSQWISLYNSADKVITYSNWAKDILYHLEIESEVASPSASEDYFKINSQSIKQFKLSTLNDVKLVGTVMRNQPRKLFNELFEGFAKFLKTTTEKVLLYCHTTFPDFGWDLNELLIKHKLLSHVVFTYKCRSCQNVYPDFFRDVKCYCPFCGKNTSSMPDGNSSVDDKSMNKILNMFDCYVQISSREGFGMPQIEAAACDVPVINIPYAGMTDMINTINATPCDISAFTLNYPMCMMEAIPDTSKLAELIAIAIKKEKDGSIRKLFEKNYSWENAYQVWKNAVDSTPIRQWVKSSIKELSFPNFGLMNNYEYAKWIVNNILEVDDNYLISRITKDLNNGTTSPGFCGNYFMENVEMKQTIPFDRKIIFNLCMERKNYNDSWNSAI
jgi:glycosyltransferase involved in cell wall biosynthesis